MLITLSAMMLSACCKPDVIIKPEPVNVYVPQFIPVDESLTRPCHIPEITERDTWGNALLILIESLEVCADKVDKIRELQPE